MTYAKIYELWEWMVGGVWVQLGGGDMEDGSTFGGFLVSSLLLFFSLDLGPVQMASAWVFTSCHWRWSFPVRRIR